MNVPPADESAHFYNSSVKLSEEFPEHNARFAIGQVLRILLLELNVVIWLKSAKENDVSYSFLLQTPLKIPKKSRKAEIYLKQLREMHHLCLTNMCLSQR